MIFQPLRLCLKLLRVNLKCSQAIRIQARSKSPKRVILSAALLYLCAISVIVALNTEDNVPLSTSVDELAVFAAAATPHTALATADSNPLPTADSTNAILQSAVEQTEAAVLIVKNTAADNAPTATSNPHFKQQSAKQSAQESAQESNAVATLSSLDNAPTATANPHFKQHSAKQSAQESAQESNAVATLSSLDNAPTATANPHFKQQSAPVVTQPYLDDAPWIIAQVKKGDTLSHIFERHNLSSRAAYAIAALADAKSLQKVRPGEELKLKIREDGQLGILQYSFNKFETLIISSEKSNFEQSDTEENNYAAVLQIREPEIRVNNARATIYSSLIEASTEAGITRSIMSKFIDIFAWQVDFSTDLRLGDNFLLIYEEHYLDDEKIGDGEVIAAELLVSGEKLRAIRHTDDTGLSRYYAPNGSGIESAFLRSPIKFAQITSGFKRRFHPIHKVWRAHKGVDYGAPQGTPIMATGDGTVELARRKGGYGKTVILRHGSKYETLYAHLSGYGKGIKSGAKVQQGDIIGYVGNTGLSTGPHLHYEFRLHGVHKDPVTVELPNSTPIDKKFKPVFQQLASRWSKELDHLNRIPLAQNLTINEYN